MKRIKFLVMAFAAILCVCSFVACSNDEEKNTYWVSIQDGSTNYYNNSSVMSEVSSLVKQFKDQYGSTLMTSSEANGQFETLCAKVVSTVSSKGLAVFTDTYCTLALQQATSSSENLTTATKKVTFTSNAERSNASFYLFITSTDVMNLVSKVDLECYNPVSNETVKRTITSADNMMSEESIKNFVSALNPEITGDAYFVYGISFKGVKVGQELTATASWTLDQSKVAAYESSKSVNFVVPKVRYCIYDGIRYDSNLTSVQMQTGAASKIIPILSEKTSSTMTKVVDF